MKLNVFLIITSLICLFFSRGCISDYLGGGDEEMIAKYEKMIVENISTQGILEPEYTEKTHEIVKIPLKTYEFRYNFKIGNLGFSGKIALDSLPNTPFIKIYYLEEDPGFNSPDPESELIKEKAKERPVSSLFIGIIWGILSISSLILIIIEFRKKKKIRTRIKT